tara:strand:- start:302 stop:1069 length:768 start_codon:yes stop_codon:yes gene_type:complete
MRQEPPKIDYILVGNGRMAGHILRYFNLLNLKVAQWSREGSASPNKTIGTATFRLQTIEQISAYPNTPILIAVSDDSILSIVNTINQFTKSPLIHFSGALSSEKLNGAAFSMHPLYTFNYEPMSLAEYEKIPFTCEPKGPDFKQIFPALKNPNVKIPNSNRRLYHSLACLASNLPAMIWNQCAEISSDNLNLDWSIYRPLVEQTLRNAFTRPQDCVTGPIIRRDWNLVDSQLEVLPQGTATEMYELVARNSKESQ